MCAICGCSNESHAMLTDLQTGQHLHFQPNQAEGHWHRHNDHTHAHSHEHEGSHIHRTQPDRLVRLEIDVLNKNSRLAKYNQGWFEGRGILALNLMSSPGAGKTSLLERTIRDIGERMSIQVIEGDQATTRDAERIRSAGGRVVQINTGKTCHLDAQMLMEAAKQLNPPSNSLIVIENIGNLVCPALFDLGEHAKVVVTSVTEGDDKPLKYPHMFQAADLIILNKIDLLPHVEFNVESFTQYLRQTGSQAEIIQLSVSKKHGLQTWYDWLEQLRFKTKRT